MQRYAWRGKVADGKVEEYKKRHDEIWPEMKALLKQAGIRNYTIWRSGHDLFGYYECEHGIEYAAKTQRESPIIERWNKYMEDILIMEMDKETGAQPKLEQVFFLE